MHVVVGSNSRARCLCFLFKSETPLSVFSIPQSHTLAEHQEETETETEIHTHTQTHTQKGHHSSVPS